MSTAARPKLYEASEYHALRAHRGALNDAQDPPARVSVLGIHVSVTTPALAVQTIRDWIAAGDRQYVCVADVNALLHAREDPFLKQFYNRSGMTLPDGMPLVWAGRAAGFSHMTRVCGPDLLPQVLQESVQYGWKHYFLGGPEGLAQRLADAMCARFPGLRVAGVESPPFREPTVAERAEQAERINASGADIVWVGLGAPKQELWMADFRCELEAPVLIGVGAAFAFHAGDLARAPVPLQKASLEWAYRLYKEPRRLWRRYFFGIPRFLTGLATHPPKAVPRKPRQPIHASRSYNVTLMRMLGRNGRIESGGLDAKYLKKDA